MINDILILMAKESKPYVNIAKNSVSFEDELKKEWQFLNDGMLIKISEFGEEKDDGVYLSKKKDNKYLINIVKNSLRTEKEISIDDFKYLIVYSYIVRTLSYMKSTQFDGIRYFTKKTEIIINKYL